VLTGLADIATNGTIVTSTDQKNSQSAEVVIPGAEEMFRYHLQFMDTLVEISAQLPEVPSDQYCIPLYFV
jgi:hypothetical protein